MRRASPYSSTAVRVASVAAVLLTTTLLATQAAPRVVSPVTWRAYVGDWPDLPDLDAAGEPVAAGTEEGVTLAVAPRPDRYALRFTGHLETPRRGRYVVWTESDDGSRLWLDDELVVDNGGVHGRRRVEANVELDAGRHAFRLDYHEAGGGEYLAVGIDGPFPIVTPRTTRPDGDLWYAAPARRWLEALPIGNGRLGAMVFGGIDRERLQLNEDSMWPGRDVGDPTNAKPEAIPRWREMLFRGDHVEVDREVMPAFSAGRVVRSHQTLGDLHVEWLGPDVGTDCTEYARTLDLASGIATTTFDRSDTRHTRQVFASATHDLLAMRITLDDEADASRLAFAVMLTRPADRGRPTAAVTVDAEAREIVLAGELTQHAGTLGDGDAGHAFRAVAAIDVDAGTVTRDADRLVVRGARAATIWLAGTTAWYGDDVAARCARRIATARRAGWPTIRDAHVAEHVAAFRTASLVLPSPVAGVTDLPTDERLARVRTGGIDPALDALLFDYGRYLLLGCSRPGTLPANLQGLWNEHVEAPWNADYHLNVNLQMNYWPAEVANLAALTEPLVAFTERLAARGRVRARDAFGMRGWVTGHATDAWAPAWHRSTEPFWGFWHHGGGWLVQHIVDHWRFGGDDAWMRTRGWPLLAGCARFYVDWLCADPATGELVSGPSTSPENSFVLPDGRRAATCMGPAMDHQIIGRVFRDTLDVAAALDLDDALVDEVRAANAKLAPGVRLGPDGRILEWHRAVAEAEPGHRHMSHLWALYPGDAIDPIRTPALAAAARKTIDHRLARGGAGTGWSRAWMIAFMARLHDGEAAWHHLQMLFRRSMADNLFDLHPPFQIDGNFGAAAGVAEMLLQSTHGVLEILPALPNAWAASGRFDGLRARGGFEVAAAWRDATWTEITIRSTLGRDCVLRLRPDVEITTHDGEAVAAEVGADGTVRFPTGAGGRYVVRRRR